jgi:peroxiredoxin
MKGTLMTRTGLGAAVVVFAATAAALAGEGKAKAQLGEPAPAFMLADSQGQKRSLADFKGKLVILEWINPECPYVVNCYKGKAMQTAYDKVKRLDSGVVWLAINTTFSTTPAQNDNWIRQYGLEYPILLDTDGKVGKLYDARRTPHMFVIDKEGILRYQGAIDDNRMGGKSVDEAMNYVVNAVAQITGGETVAPDFMKPYGCSVKYAK